MREKSGAISFEFPEYKILLAEDGTPLKIVRKDRTIAEKIIEACMLIANETVACYYVTLINRGFIVFMSSQVK